MSRIATRFSELGKRGRKALVPYVTAGDPEPELTVPLMHGLVEAGADLLELGVPFSDPMADGPVIQAACERALAHGVSLTDVLGMVGEFRKRDTETPVVIMGYLNPVEVMEYEKFADNAAEAGVDGVLTVDMPPEEAADLATALTARSIDPIFLLSPTSDAERIGKVAAVAQGFVYYVSFKGVTGANRLDTDAVAARVAEIRTHTELPIGVGFGIRDAQSAASVSRIADAVIVGSALVSRIAELQNNPGDIIDTLSGVVADMRAAMDAAAGVDDAVAG